MTMHSTTALSVIAADQSIGWLMLIVAVWTWAICFLVFALFVVGPPLWKEGRSIVRSWLEPERSNVRDFEERRRLNRVMGGR